MTDIQASAPIAVSAPVNAGASAIPAPQVPLTAAPEQGDLLTQTAESTSASSPADTGILQEPASKDGGSSTTESVEWSADSVLELFPEASRNAFTDTSKAEVLDLFKTLNVSKEQASKLANFWTARQAEAQSLAEQQVSATVEAWKTETKADPVIGGAGLSEAMAGINKMLGTLPKELTAPFYQLLGATGLSNNPATLRVLHALSQKVNPGKVTAGEAPVATRPDNQTLSAILYNGK